ncbi:MAG TPA: amidohydrolase family protein [Blastocatellia bacterium]|nr:amidohydrolase family protein [Blastocatellia bacterium]
MKLKLLAPLLGLLLTAPPPAVVFVNVNVVPMDRERILENQMVVIRDGRIAELGPAGKVKVPAGAQQIDGRGKYLMPGLAEMHGHLPGPNQSPEVADSFLLLFLANGVTTVRGMFGFPNHVKLREQVARGEILGPTLYVAGPALSGQSAQNVEDARRMAREQKAAGYDLLKVHEGLSREVYDAIVTTAAEVGLPFGGHIPNAVGLPHALKMKQSSVEHLDGYLEELGEDERKIPQLAALTREAGAWNAPTMALWQNFFSGESAEALRRRPEVKYMPAQMVGQWEQQRANQLQNQPGPEELRRMLALRDKMLKGLRDAGARLLLASDAPQLFSVPGFSLHREMQAMARAGLTPYEVIEAGTRNAAAYLKASDQFGTVEVGRRADLILLDDNPLKDVANVARRAGVMVRGRWLPESELRQKLDQLAAARGAQ